MPTFFWPNVLPNMKPSVRSIRKIFPLEETVTNPHYA